VSVGKLHTKAMQKEHNVPMVGNRGEHTIGVIITKTLYWPEMKEDVEHFVCTCV
jgi:hypothetical protein